MLFTIFHNLEYSSYSRSIEKLCWRQGILIVEKHLNFPLKKTIYVKHMKQIKLSQGVLTGAYEGIELLEGI